VDSASAKLALAKQHIEAATRNDDSDARLAEMVRALAEIHAALVILDSEAVERQSAELPVPIAD
jgi:hypothetical protein